MSRPIHVSILRQRWGRLARLLAVAAAAACGRPEPIAVGVATEPATHPEPPLAATTPATEPAAAAPAASATAASPEGFTEADFAAHLAKLRQRTPDGFTIVLERPFVVIGDEAPNVVRSRAIGTVRWAVTRLKRDFFERDPNQILDVWLFRDAASYSRHVRELFGEEPSTPYGYYSSDHGALIMNIATGGGTLVHEIVHPFMESNFPECPAWFNEGLGSLFEQSADRNGHIVGLTNWRLPGLQQAIRARSLPALRRLTAATEHEFYERDPGTNYAQARYLLYYLQEQGLLVGFMRQLRASHRTDPTGYETLRRVLGNPDMAMFQRRWETYVLGLRFE